jgi:hypothetical protein
MKTKLHSLGFLALLAIVTLSCSKDDPKPDPRTAAMGTYNYTTKYYYINADNELEFTDDDLTETGTAIAAVTDNGFQISEGGKVQFKAVKVTEASNGFTFDIESQTITEDGQTVTISGYEGATLTTAGGSVTKYDGVFLKADKKLEAYFQFQVTIDGVPYTFVIQTVAFKA